MNGEYIFEKMSAAEKKKAAEKIMDEMKGENKKNKGKGKKSSYTKYLEKQLEFKRQKYEDQKRRQIEKLKEKSSKESEGKVKSALSSIKYDTISHKDSDPTAYKKAIGNVGSAALGLGKSAYHALKSKKNQSKAEKEAEQVASKQPEKKEPGKPGRRPNPKSDKKDIKKVSVRDLSKKEPKKITGTPERVKIKSGSDGGESSAPKMLPPASGSSLTLGRRARKNPRLKSMLIKSRMQKESYSNWREEFIFEVDDKKNKKDEKEKIIDVMSGKNKIEINPNINEDHKEIESGKKKDDEGYMANIEFDSIERAIKSLRKKINKPDAQIPAWVQSKITRAADFIDTAAEYLQSDEKISEEKEEKRYCKLCRKEETKGDCKYGPSMWEKYSINEMAPAIASIGRIALASSAREGTKVAAKEMIKQKLKSGVENALTKAGQRVNPPDESVTPEEGGASAYRKALSNIVKIGEEVEIDESKKSEMPCNKPKAESHGSGETGKSHVVKACSGGQEKLIRFGQKGVKGSPKKEGESEKYANRRKRFQARHAKNIAKGKMSAAYWANKVKW